MRSSGIWPAVCDSAVAAQSRLIIDQDDLIAAFSGRQSGLHSRPSAADHRSVRMHPAMFVLRWSRQEEFRPDPATLRIAGSAACHIPGWVKVL